MIGLAVEPVMSYLQEFRGRALAALQCCSQDWVWLRWLVTMFVHGLPDSRVRRKADMNL
jgi:hypothetical protein